MTETTRRSFCRLGLLLPAVSLLSRVTEAADGLERIGCIYPLSGNAASVGQCTKTAIELETARFMPLSCEIGGFA